jgi:hypothetical protein
MNMNQDRTFEKQEGRYVYKNPENGVGIVLRRKLRLILVEWIDVNGDVHDFVIIGGNWEKAFKWVNKHINEDGEFVEDEYDG